MAKNPDSPPGPDRPPSAGGWHNGHEVTELNRVKVKTLAQALTEQRHIAQILGISTDTLTKYYRHELDQGEAESISAISASYVKAALDGDRKAQRVVLEKKGGWVTRHEHSGRDGKPIEYKELSETEIDARLRELEEKYGPRPTDSIN